MACTPLAQRLQDAFVAAERERQGDCFFAGEHTSVDFQGYLNGAVETGERAAGEILDDLT
jgi:monoamine oxidase